jgi:hypothetical protein
MFTKPLKKFPLLLLGLIFTACSVLTPAVPTKSAVDIDKEEQAVYAFFVNNNSKVLILQDTSTNIGEDDLQKTVEYIKSGLKGLSNETLDNYLERNKQPSQLSANMNLGVDYVLLSQEDLSKITSQPNWSELMTEKYPGTHGYTVFSRVGFNNSLDQAVIYVGSVGGPLMGAGYYYLMEKQKGQWDMKEQVRPPLSASAEEHSASGHLIVPPLRVPQIRNINLDWQINIDLRI